MNVSFLFNPRKLVPTKIEPFTVVATVEKVGIPGLFGRVVHTSVNTQLIITFRGKKLSVVIHIVKLGHYICHEDVN